MDNNQDKKCNMCGGGNCPKCKGNSMPCYKKIIFLILIFLGLGIVLNLSVKTYADYTNPRTISIAGTGEILSVPDISTINFTIRSSSINNDTKILQDEVAKKADKVLEKLKELDILEKDIQTANYSVNPKYNYKDGSSNIVGYEASENINVKVRNIENVSKVLNILAEEKITEVYGPNFEIDNVENLKNQARGLAIKDAKEKAKDLSKSLGVKIKKIVSYYDNNESNMQEFPMYSAKMDIMGASAGSVSRNANISEGEQKINSNVTIIFQIED